MLTQIELRHFKCFEILKLPLRPLTLLSGWNASGKSSVLQALALLQQTMRQHEWSNRLMLNGDVLSLGTVADVVDQLHSRTTCGIAVIDESCRLDWSFSGDRADMSMLVERVVSDGAVYDRPAALRWLIPPALSERYLEVSERLRSMSYITAERVGPREVYPLEDSFIAGNVGPVGEYAASVLHRGRDRNVIQKLVAGSPPTRLQQVTKRMEEFFPGFGMSLDQIPHTNSVVLRLRSSPETEYFRTINVGFGMTQVLPIVVAALSAAENDILLIENPEVHLHPAGQARMGGFLSEVASAGIQVVVETHSDHVLSGVRRAVKGTTLSANDTAIHFFRSPSEEDEQVVSPALDRDGNIDYWPDGFFDQFDKDASHFAGWGE